MSEQAQMHKETGVVDKVLTATIASGDIHQLGDGRAGVRVGLNSLVSGDTAGFATEGQFKVNKSTSVFFIDGQEIWWDDTNGQATYALAGDFPLGTAVGDAAAAATTVVVDLNIRPRYAIVQGEGGWTEASALGLGVTQLGGIAQLAFDAVAEIAMAAYYSDQTVAIADKPIFEAEVAIYDIGNNAALDFSVGLANGTSATDFDAVTESAIIHLDGNSLDILAESDDGTTEVDATDTTKDAVDDTYSFVQIDARDATSVKIYINGARVLSTETFVLTAATGPLLAIAHIEKTSDDTTADLRVRNMRVRKSAA